MTELDEALRALEKAVESVEKATRGPWTFINEKADDCLLAFGTDSLEYDAPPPWYSCWAPINPDDGRALIAAVNFIREHGRALLTTRQGVAPVAYIEGNQYRTQAGALVRFVKTYNVGTSYETMEDEEGVHRYTRRDFGRVTGSPHDYSDPRNTPPLYTTTGQTSDARDAQDAARYRFLIPSLYREDFTVGEAAIQLHTVGPCPTVDDVAAAIDAAMRQEAE